MDKELAALAAQLGIDDPEKLQALQDLVQWIMRKVKEEMKQDIMFGR